MSGVMVSGEGVALELEPAGAGSRTVAAALDLIVQFIALIAIFIADAFLLGDDSAADAAVLITEAVVVLAGYPIVMEWLTRGRTLGKLALGLRVVRDDGGPVGLRQSMVRGLTGFFIEKPGLILGGLGVAVGLITITASNWNKRVGDHLAGTFVIRERAATQSALAVPQFQVPYYLQSWAMALDLTRLDDHLALGIRQFVLRANQMTPAARDQLGAQFTNQLLSVVTPAPPMGTPIPLILTTVLAERRRRSEFRGW
jgi:uncharacterized RDD family membrane protein YckC